MKLERRVVDGVAVIRLSEAAEIDVGSRSEFKQGFVGLLETSDRRVVFDGALVEFFDSAGMGSLLSLQKHIKERDGELVITGLNRSVTEVFRMVGFDVIFRTFPDVDEALRALQE
jgi:anti-sigma B factor antagonist